MNGESTAYNDLSDQPSVLDLILAYGSGEETSDYYQRHPATASSAAANMAGWADAGDPAMGGGGTVVDTSQSSLLDALAKIAADTSRLALDWFNAVGGGGGGVQSTAGTITPSKAATPTPGGISGIVAALGEMLPFLLVAVVAMLFLFSPGRRRR